MGEFGITRYDTPFGNWGNKPASKGDSVLYVTIGVVVVVIVCAGLIAYNCDVHGIKQKCNSHWKRRHQQENDQSTSQAISHSQEPAPPPASQQDLRDPDTIRSLMPNPVSAAPTNSVGPPSQAVMNVMRSNTVDHFTKNNTRSTGEPMVGGFIGPQTSFTKTASSLSGHYPAVLKSHS
jgi:hypothetical protein